MNENDIVQKLDTWNESYFLMVDFIIIFQGRLNVIRKFKKKNTFGMSYLFNYRFCSPKLNFSKFTINDPEIILYVRRNQEVIN